MRRGQQAHQQPRDDVPALGGVIVMLYRQFGIFLGLLLLIMVILAAVALGSWNVTDPSLSYAGEGHVTNMLGYWGAVGADLAMQFLGLGAVLALLAPFFWSLLLIAQRSIRFLPRRTGYWLMSVVFFSTALAALPFSINWPLPTGLGGVIGDKLLAFFIAFEMFLPIFAIKILVIIMCAPLGLLSHAPEKESRCRCCALTSAWGTGCYCRQACPSLDVVFCGLKAPAICACSQKKCLTH